MGQALTMQQPKGRLIILGFLWALMVFGRWAYPLGNPHLAAKNADVLMLLYDAFILSFFLERPWRSSVALVVAALSLLNLLPIHGKYASHNVVASSLLFGGYLVLWYRATTASAGISNK